MNEKSRAAAKGGPPNQTKESGRIANKMRKHMEAFVELSKQRGAIERGTEHPDFALMGAFFWASMYIVEFQKKEMWTDTAPGILCIGQFTSRKGINILCNWGADPVGLFRAWVPKLVKTLVIDKIRVEKWRLRSTILITVYRAVSGLLSWIARIARRCGLLKLATRLLTLSVRVQGRLLSKLGYTKVAEKKRGEESEAKG